MHLQPISIELSVVNLGHQIRADEGLTPFNAAQDKLLTSSGVRGTQFSRPVTPTCAIDYTQPRSRLAWATRLIAMQ